MRTSFYVVLICQVKARSSIVDNLASEVDAQQVFKSTFNALINEDYSISIDIDRYQSILEHALSKMDFSKGTSFYMPPSNLNLSTGKIAGCSNNILISST